MAGQFLSPTGEDLQQIYVDDYNLIDQYAATGSLWTWGRSTNGQLGQSNITHRSSPIQTIVGGTNWKLVSNGNYHTTAIKTDGTLWTWGLNANGQLGINDIVHRSSPIQTVSGGTNWKLIDSGYYFSAAIKTDGTLWTWGNNGFGQLGDGSSIVHRSSPIQTVSGGTNWKLVAGGQRHIAAIKTNGALWTWGYNSNGQLGNSGIGSTSSPVQTVAAGTNWKLVACGGYHTSAIKTDGTLWIWGFNTHGQLGVNDIAHRSSPVQTVAGGTNWKQVACGRYHTSSIKNDGTLWSWGHNGLGSLGINDIVHRSSPIQTVSGGTNWKLVDSGLYHTAAIKTNGELWAWGWNSTGNLGDNTIANKSSPVQTVAAGTNWKQVACGGGNTTAIYFYDAGNLYPSA